MQDMQEILDGLGTLPGVVGSLVCGDDGRLLASAFPPLFDQQLLTRAAELVSDETSVMKGLKGPDVLVELRYQNGRVFAKPILQGTLAVVGTAGVNAQLLGMSLNLAVKKLERSAADGLAVPPQRPAPPAPPVLAGFAQIRERLKEALIRQIGPIGAVVFERAATTWSAGGPPTRDSVRSLVVTLRAEIDDSASREEFSREVAKILS